jgi:hypothetical protein
MTDRTPSPPAVLLASASWVLLGLCWVQSGWFVDIWTAPDAGGDASRWQGVQVEEAPVAGRGGQAAPSGEEGSGQAADLASGADAEPRTAAVGVPSDSARRDPAEPLDPLPVDGGNPRCAVRLNEFELGRAVRRRRVARTEQPFVADGGPFFAWVDGNNRLESVDRVLVRWTHLESGHAVETSAPFRMGMHAQALLEQSLPATMVGTWQVELLEAGECLLMTTTMEVLPLGWQSGP